MQTCWKADANERPQFADIRPLFNAMLEEEIAESIEYWS